MQTKVCERVAGMRRTEMCYPSSDEVEWFLKINNVGAYNSTTVSEFKQLPLTYKWCCTNRTKAKLFCVAGATLRLSLLEKLISEFSEENVNGIFISFSETHNFCVTVSNTWSGESFVLDFYPREPNDTTRLLQLFSNQNPVGRRVESMKWDRDAYEAFFASDTYQLWPVEFVTFFRKWNELYFCCDESLFTQHDIVNEGLSDDYVSNLISIRCIQECIMESRVKFSGSLVHHVKESNMSNSYPGPFPYVVSTPTLPQNNFRINDYSSPRPNASTSHYEHLCI